MSTQGHSRWTPYNPVPFRPIFGETLATSTIQDMTTMMQSNLERHSDLHTRADILLAMYREVPPSAYTLSLLAGESGRINQCCPGLMSNLSGEDQRDALWLLWCQDWTEQRIPDTDMVDQPDVVSSPSPGRRARLANRFSRSSRSERSTPTGSTRILPFLPPAEMRQRIKNINEKYKSSYGGRHGKLPHRNRMLALYRDNARSSSIDNAIESYLDSVGNVSNYFSLRNTSQDDMEAMPRVFRRIKTVTKWSEQYRPSFMQGLGHLVPRPPPEPVRERSNSTFLSRSLV